VTITFKKATKSRAKLRMALVGPSGGGKTYTALAVAKYLLPGGRVALVDTERGSASKYADLFTFDTVELIDSFHPRRYVECIKAAAAAGYDVLILDSLSHAWIGPGGALDLHDAAVDRQKTKNTFTAWKEVTPHHVALIEAILQAPMHVIATIRAKTEYAQEKDERTGKTQVRKVGMSPVQRDGLEYEFDVVGDLDIENNLIINKTRCPELAGAVLRKPGRDLAERLAAWLSDGAAPAKHETDRATGIDGTRAAAPPEGNGDFGALVRQCHRTLVARERTWAAALKWLEVQPPEGFIEPASEDAAAWNLTDEVVSEAQLKRLLASLALKKEKVK
jgi:AAA domain